jgi:hypothetical protein
MSLRSMAVTKAARDTDADVQQEQDRLLNQLVNLIPGEAIALFVALMAATANYNYRTRLWMFWIVLVMTPLWVAANYLIAAKPEALARKPPLKRLPWFDMCLGSVAFIAWSVTVPHTPFSEHALFISDSGLSVQDGVLVTLIASAVLGFLNAFGPRIWIALTTKQRTTPPPTPPSP